MEVPLFLYTLSTCQLMRLCGLCTPPEQGATPKGSANLRHIDKGD